ncbi:PD-(D/E)XK nuclease family protein [Helicobacter cappadocius]|uniref:PD-(D/E)XK nuclease family protein n=1 Tax=Helicobacter cappadocius TaxID=3063998 RepID=A0AA90T936_9HELI|nr:MULTISPECIES: PD-(D/E)XK nuclease family protein [unclassified Helicobacter]MDO7252580.1 PD-(D/E)XK nuclease family protein [Helicobacter sp. faydin-H75]MDP2538447.1 PD-(D/E)XK nuclease family protein [Helicobacter sp. faydin-H76]
MKELFEQKSPLYVFSTQRYINEFYREFEDGFLPQVMGAGEFFSTIVFVPFLKAVPKNIRKVFLLSAIAQAENLTSMLVFEKSFLAYLESSSFLFNFFDEMTSFLIDIKQIPLKDTYGDYEDHLQVLFGIYEKYTQKLKEYGFYDALVGNNYEILNKYFENNSCVEFYLDGFLSTQEKQILTKVSEVVPVFLHIKTDQYNLSHFDFLNIAFEPDYEYKINLGNSEIISKKSIANQNEIQVFGFSSRLSQTALVFARVNEWLSSGIDPQKVAIITPSEDFAKYLKLLDKHNNLNLAMGKNIAEYPYIQTLKNKLKSIKETPLQEKEHPLYWLVQITNEVLESNSDKGILINFHDELITSYEKIKNIFDEFSYCEILELYLSDFMNFRIDDASGGKIKVMGVLESRGLSFEAVVIVDFNDQFVPSYKDSDMFLNTTIRKSLQIPTVKDRQDLQKHYYLQIFKNTHKVDIVFTNTESNPYSKMLDELDLSEKIINGDEKYTIFPINEEKIYKKEEIVLKIPSDFVFSASKLNTFFSCKRRFYYAYIEKLTPPKDSSGEISSIIHQALNLQYSAFIGKVLDVQTIKNNFQKYIDQFQVDSKINKLKIEMAAFELQNFWKIEQKRSFEGCMVLGCEQEFRTNIAGFNFLGRIDRIDELDGVIYLIDYKYKSKLKVNSKKETQYPDFQLAVYDYGARSLGYDGKIKGYIYDLKKGELLEEESFEKNKQKLLEELKIFHEEINFETTEEKKTCRYCPYEDICCV